MMSVFKSLVDAATTDPVFLAGDLAAQYAVLGLRLGTGQNISGVLDGIKGKVTNHLVATGDAGSLDYSIFQQIRQANVYEMVITGTANTTYLDISEALRNCAPGDNKYVDVDHWLPAITWAKAYQAVNNRVYPPPPHTLRFDHPREYDTALSIQSLILEGCTINWQEGEVEILSGIDQVIDKLEQLIAEIGGQNLIRNLIPGIIAKAYKPSLDRYVYAYTVPLFCSKRTSKRPSSIPRPRSPNLKPHWPRPGRQMPAPTKHEKNPDIDHCVDHSHHLDGRLANSSP
jgi:hypothetical protein